MGRLVQQPAPARANRKHSAGRSRGKILRRTGSTGRGRVTQTKWPPTVPVRFKELAATLDKCRVERRHGFHPTAKAQTSRLSQWSLVKFDLPALRAEGDTEFVAGQIDRFA